MMNESDDPKMRAILDGKRRKRRHGWKTSADFCNPAKAKVSQEDIDWLRDACARIRAIAKVVS